MDDGAIIGIVIACLFVIILILLWLYYCKRNAIGPFRGDQERRGLVNGQQTSDRDHDRKKGVLLTKRCEQDNMEVRVVEGEIIKRMQIREKTWGQESVDDGQSPVLVFCVNASRIGTDIESALRGVNEDLSQILMVVLHCKNPSALRGDLSDDDYLLDEGLRRRFTGIAHFAFSDREGLYSCRQNEDGFRKLSNLLKSVQ